MIEHCPECGWMPDAKKRKPRSVPQNRRYFALLRAAFNHWPESHRFQPSSEEHLRAWLQAKAGHRTVTTIDMASMSKAQAAKATQVAIAAATSFVFCHAVGEQLHIVQSASIAFDKLPHLDACALFDSVADIIEIETGIRVDDMLKFTPRSKPQERVASEIAL